MYTEENVNITGLIHIRSWVSWLLNLSCYFPLYHTPLPFINAEDRDVLKLSFAPYAMPQQRIKTGRRKSKFIGCPSPGILIIKKLRNSKLALKNCLHSNVFRII